MHLCQEWILKLSYKWISLTLFKPSVFDSFIQLILKMPRASSTLQQTMQFTMLANRILQQVSHKPMYLLSDTFITIKCFVEVALSYIQINSTLEPQNVDYYREINHRISRCPSLLANANTSVTCNATWCLS